MSKLVVALGMVIMLVAASWAAAQSDDEPILIIGDDIQFTVDEISYFTGFEGEAADEGLLMLIKAHLLADTSRCIHGYDFALMLDGERYEASTKWMGRLKEFVGRIHYPGWGLRGQCFDADEETPTFLVFDIPTESEEVKLQFFESVYQFEEWSPATALPTLTPSKTATRTSTRTPTPASSRAPGVNDATRNAQSYNTGLTEAWEVQEEVVRVDFTTVRDNYVFGQVCVEKGYVNEAMALQLFLETKIFLNNAELQFSVIISDENEAADFRFDTRRDEWVITPLSGTSCG